MKAILFVLVLGVLSCSAVNLRKQQQYETITTPSAAENELLNWGLDKVITDAKNAGKLPNNAFTLSKINSIQKASGVGTDYKFDVVATDGKGTTASVKFSIYVSWDGKKQLSSWNYSIVTASTTSQAQNQSFQDVYNPSATDNAHLNWGLQQVIQKGQAAGRINPNPFTLSKVNSIQKQAGYTTNYNFDVVATDGKGSLVTAKFSVNVDASGNRQLTSWNYKTSFAPTEYVNVPTNDAGAQAALKWGLNQLIEIGKSKGRIPASNYSVEKVNSITSRYVVGEKEYNFDIVFSNGVDVRVTATFTVNVSEDDGSMSMGTYNYFVKTGKL